MATTNTALRIAELDFDSIRTNLKTFLQSQDEFSDYNFDGSGLSVLLDLLAYNTHYMAMQLNMTANEMFLDTAQLRSSVVSHAKNLNYIPRSKTAAQASINVKVTPGSLEDQDDTSLTLSRYTRFLSNPIDGVSYNFVAVNANTAFKTANGTFEFSNVIIKQGESVSRQYLVDQNNPTRKYVIPSSSIDTDTLRIQVQTSEANTVTHTYNEADDITEITSNSRVYFIEELPESNGHYQFSFGDGVIGTNLANGNIILINYIDTLGSEANFSETFNAVDGIGDYDANVIVTTVSSSFGGSEKESIEQIRKRAPLFYTTQNRLVTKNDYQTILLSDYPNIEAISVWGGDENDPPIYGKVFLSMKPVDNYAITELEKERIKDYVIANRAVLTVFPEIVNPDYTYLLIRATINYNPAMTTKDENELKQLVRAAILDYRESDLKSFNSIFRKSKLQRLIDNTDDSFISSSLEVFAQKRFEPELNSTKNYNIKYNIPLLKSGGSPSNKLFSYPEITVLDNSNISRNVFIEEIPNSYTGIDKIVVNSSGSEYTTEPTVTVTGDGTGATATAKVVNGKISSITVVDRGIDYTRATVSITGGGGSGATATAKLEAKNGVLRTYYFKTNGEKTIVNSNAGTIDYQEGKIILSSFNPSDIIANALYDDATLTINVKPEKETVATIRNQILEIDEDDSSSILITMIAEE